MNTEEIREYCLRKKGVNEGFPFGNEVLVFKVINKIFLLLSLDAFPLSINVKCDPLRAVRLREKYPDVVLPGYHMNKKHWNTIAVDGSLSAKELMQHINHSYELVVASLSQKEKRELNML